MIEGRAGNSNGPLHRYDFVDRNCDFIRPREGRATRKNRRLDHFAPSAGGACRASVGVISLFKNRRRQCPDRFHRPS